jgi:hypothetical protein
MTAYESRFADLLRRGSRIRSTQTPILVLGALLALSACAPLAQVREIKPRLGAQYGTLPQLRHAEQAIAEGDNLQRADPTRAVGFYLSGVQSATSELRKDPDDHVALRDYDFALSRVFPSFTTLTSTHGHARYTFRRRMEANTCLPTVQLRVASGDHRITS